MIWVEKQLKFLRFLTGEDLGYKPSESEKAKFEYSPLGMTLINNTKNKANKKYIIKSIKTNL